MRKLGDLITLVGGGTPSKDQPNYWNGNIPWATVKDLKGDYILETQDFITELGLNNSSSKIVKANQIIISTRMAVGKVAITTKDIAINQDLKGVCCGSDLHAKYLFYLFKSKESYFEKISTGATVKGIKINHINDLEIPLPPLPIQKKIAEILDTADTLKQKDKALIAKYKELTQSLFLEMFSRKKFPEIILNDLAKEEKGSFSNGPFGSDLLSSELKKEGVPVVYIRDIRNGFYKWKSNIFVTEEKAFSLPSCHIKKNDILITKVGDPPGVATIYPNEELAIMTQDVVRLRTKALINNNFLQYWMNSSLGQHRLKKIIVEGTRQRFSLKNFKLMKIPLPPIELQNQFAERVQIIEKQKQLAEQSLKKSEELFDCLLQKAFRGELVS